MRKIVFFIALAFLVALCAAPAYAVNGGPPALPHAFYGSVTVNGAAAADGTEVSAAVDSGTILTTQNPVTTEGGSYGVESLKLLIQGDIPNGATIIFYVDDVEVEGVTATFEAGGGPTEKNLSVTISSGGGGGGGGGGRDTTAPGISDIGVCYEGVTETTADICWKTDEKSDSQVEYWASPSKLSTLDKALVIDHVVHLADLTSGATYNYKVRSRDEAGNLAVSDVYSFTTLEEVLEEVTPPPPEEVTPPPEEVTPPPPEEVTPTLPEEELPPVVKPQINWPVVGWAIAGVVVIGLLVFFLVRREREG